MKLLNRTSYRIGVLVLLAAIAVGVYLGRQDEAVLQSMGYARPGLIPTRLVHGATSVTYDNTPEQITTTSTPIFGVLVIANDGNAYPIYVGNDSMDTLTGIKLNAGDAISLDFDNLNKIYIDSDDTGSVVGVRYIGLAYP